MASRRDSRPLQAASVGILEHRCRLIDPRPKPSPDSPTTRIHGGLLSKAAPLPLIQHTRREGKRGSSSSSTDTTAHSPARARYHGSSLGGASQPYIQPVRATPKLWLRPECGKPEQPRVAGQ